MTRLRLFVYGSLKRGYANHQRFCRGVHSMEDAEIAGSLFQMPTGYPVLRFPKGLILARGSGDLRADLETQQRLCEHLAAAKGSPSQPPSPAGNRVHGSLMTFSDPIRRLRAIDGLEEFRPGRRSRYERVLIQVYSRIAQSQETAWTYIAGDLSPQGKRIPTGKWTSRGR
jgi:gamma-glutamylcyclotransferase (GGCT)/AIG2-like uncharacterized protein YtfP